MSRISCVTCLLAVLHWIPLCPSFAQQPTEILRGRVFADDAPVVGATVTAVGLKSGIEKRAVTDGNGVYTIIFTEAEAEYVATIRAVGFNLERRPIRRVGASTLIITNFELSKIASTLSAVETKGKKVRRQATPDDRKSIGGNERDLKEDGVLFSLDPSDLATLMIQMPGVTFIPGLGGQPGRFSVLGASPEENNILVDGSTFGGSKLPPGAIRGASLITSTFDPSVGQFGGGQLSISTISGTNLRMGKLGTRVSGSALTWRDKRSTVATPTDLLLDGTFRGPLIQNRLFYVVSFQANRTSAVQPSLTHPNQTISEQYGLVADTIRLLGETLQNQGIPLSAGSQLGKGIRDAVTTYFKISAAPSATTAAEFSVGVSKDDQSGQGIQVTSFPATGMSRTGQNTDVRLSVSGYLNSLLNEFRVSLSDRRDRRRPSYSIPGGVVSVPSKFSDGRAGLVSLQFGGSPFDANTESTRRFELSHEASWFSIDSRHRIKFAGLWQTDRARSDVQSSLGTFQYQTLSDLVAGTPTSYTRTLFSRSRLSDLSKWALSLGDEWTPGKTWRFEYGMRWDGSKAGSRPSYNGLVDSLFGHRTDYVPKLSDFSPRFGFSYGHGGSRLASGEVIPPGGWRYVTKEARKGAKPPFYINGGIGAFRNVMNPSTIAALMDATGLPDATRRLTCVGAATPIPNWSDFMTDASSVPDQCLDGTAAAEFSSIRPDVRLYDRSFKAPVSWRASLNFSGIQALGWDAAVFLDQSLGRNGASTLDLNLRRSAVFTLPNEGDRPVYVASSAIVPGTGLMAPGASRINDQFGQVLTTVSDLKTSTSQIVLDLARNNPLFGRFPLAVNYTYLRSRVERRGIGAPTSGDPFAKSRGYGDLPTHTLNVGTFVSFRWITLVTRVSVTSGMRYTPIIGGDVNGDGTTGNDRGFIFDPSQTEDVALANEMSALLKHTSRTARKCLQRQLGSIAGFNSCKTGWTLQPVLDLRMANPERGMDLLGRVRLSVSTINVVSGLTRVFGLSNTSIARMAALPEIDPTLFYVDGYNPTSQQFSYKVNQRFGHSRANRISASRAPFQVFVKGEVNFGGLVGNKLAKEFGFFPSQGNALTEATVLTQFRRLTANPLEAILGIRDSLLLQPEQIAQLQREEARFQAQADSLYQPLANLIVAKKGKISDSELVAKLSPIRIALANLMPTSMRAVGSILVEHQKQRLPEYLQPYLSSDKK